MEINISSILHKNQRYNTCGDWFYTPNMGLNISVSKTNEDYEFLVAFHELIEAYLCKKRGITEKEVTDFDIKFEEDRKAFGFTGEPGDEKHAPYHKEHRFATKLEKLMAKELGIKWKDYEKTIDDLSQ